MKKDKLQNLKSIIAKVLSTRPTYVDIERIIDEGNNACRVFLKYQGFPYVATVENDRVLVVARRIA